jgi:hypothetical protein
MREKLKKEILDKTKAYAEKLYGNIKRELLEIQKLLAKAL